MTPMGRPTVAKAHSVGVLPRAGGVSVFFASVFPSNSAIFDTQSD
jgi:hypothetical protein